ncbi:MAG TPA: trimethylamine methyltransferase family protein, partial [Geminicoccaceae bacterium]|nr:trimethylamine methyltransferase family protein [Geminicoccaceae bacterium]
MAGSLVMSAEGRRGGREARRAIRTSAAVRSLPALRRRLPLYEVLDEEGVERVHGTAMRILEVIGIDFREDEALARWREAGAQVDGQHVRIPRDLLMGLVTKAPERFTLHARNPERSVEIGGDDMVFGPT